MNHRLHTAGNFGLDSFLNQERWLAIEEAIDAFALGESLMKEGRFSEASKELTRGLKTCPYQADALYNRAVCRIQTDDLEAAREDLCVAVAVNPDYTNARKKLAAVLIHLRLYREALAELEQFSDSDYEFAALAGECAFYVGDYRKAAIHLGYYLDRAGKDGAIKAEPWVREMRGRCLLKLGRSEEAGQELSRSLTLSPDEALVRLLQECT